MRLAYPVQGDAQWVRIRTFVIDFYSPLSVINAYSCGVQVIPLVSEGWSDEEAGASYRVLGFSGTVTGSINDITEFICELQNSSYKTLTFRDINIKSQPGLHPENPTYENDIPVTVSLSISVYTCPSIEYEDAV